MPNRPLSRVARLEQIERLLFHNAQGMRVVEIARACGVDRRTIYRDLVALERAGVPLRQEDGRYSIIREQHLATLHISLHEAVALLMAARFFARFGPAQSPYLASLLEKLGEALVEPLASHVERIVAKMRDLPPDDDFIKNLETVTLAWMLGRKVRLWHEASYDGQVRYSDLSPYFLEPTRQGRLYVIGRESGSGQVRPLDLQQVRRARILDEPAEVADRESVASV